ncbi:UNVERIFIED_CONTAM: glycerol-3-phosphate acyltransferase [Campylobacter lari]
MQILNHPILFSILFNVFLLVFGYLFIGSFNTSIIFSRYYKHDDIRNYNSGNAGATNSLRRYGKKVAIAILFIDMLKVVIPVLIMASLLNHIDFFINLRENNIFISPQVLGLGIIIGHVFPIYFKFKGGKGVACTIGLICSINIILFLIAALIFFSVVLSSKYVSLASILSASILIILV